MRTVHKFPLLGPVVFVHTHPDAPVLNVATQDGTPCLWIEVDTDAPTVPRAFFAYGTGHPVPPAVVYVGTAHDVAGAGLVFHIYEQR